MRNKPGVLISIVLLLSLTACVETAPTDVLPQAEAARLAVIMTATAEAEQARVAAGYAQATATVESYHLEVARINATATAEALVRAEAQRAEMATATAVAFYPTATAIAQQIELREIEIERERQHLAQEETERQLAMADAQRRAEAEAQREQMLLPFTTYGPWVLLAALSSLLGYGVWRAITVIELRGRAIRRDARGDAPLLLLSHGRGGLIVYDGDRAFGPAAIVNADSITMPALVAEDQQAIVTMRDQAVDLATRGLPKPDQAGQSRQKALAQRLALTGAPPQVRIVDAQAVHGWLQDVTPQALALSMSEVRE